MGVCSFTILQKKRNGALFDDTARLGLYSGLGTLYMANGASAVPAGRRRTRTQLALTELRSEDQPAIQGQGRTGPTNLTRQTHEKAQRYRKADES